MTTPPEIWAVDDDAYLLETVANILEPSGYDVRCFNNGQQVLEAARQHRPALLISDLNMPQLSGYTLIRTLRRLPNFKRLPIIVLTAMSGEALEEAFEAGADDFVCKPFNVGELIARVRTRLRSEQTYSVLDQRNRDARFMLEMSNALNSSLDFRRILRELVSQVASALEVSRCSIILLGRFQNIDSDLHSEGRSDTCLLVAASDDMDISNITLSVAAYPEVQEVIQTRRPVIVEDIDSSPLMASVRENLRELGVCALILNPMMVSDELVGVLFIRSTSAQWSMDPRRRVLALSAANIGATAIRNALVFNEIVAERTQLDRTLEEYRKIQDFLSSLIDASVDAIVASDISGEVIVFNKAAESILGYESRHVISSMRVWDLYPGDGARAIMEAMRSEDLGGHGRINAMRTQLIGNGGERVPVSISAAIVYDEAGNERATMGIFTDLRERLAMEARLARINEDLEETRRHVVAAELAGAAAHELNQPLTSAMGYIDLLTLHMKESDDQRMLTSLAEQVHRMAEIVKKIGDIAQYRTKTYLGDTRIVDLDSSTNNEEEI